MELRQLSYFVAVAEERNFTRAAERVRVAQPAISQQMMGLERELGEPLFDRAPRGVRLTAAGQAFLPHARAALAAATQGRDAVSSLRGLLSGRLSLGTVHPGPAGLAALIGMFRREHPAVELSVREGHTGPLLQELDDGHLDLAVIGLGPGRRVPSGFQGEVIQTEPIVLAIHRDHQLAGQETVSLARLRDEPMVTLPEGSGQRATLEAAALAAGFTPRVVVESSELDMLVELAANGVGAAVVPESAIHQPGRLATVRISPPALTRRLALTWREPALAPAARAFLSAVRADVTRRASSGTTEAPAPQQP